MNTKRMLIVVAAAALAVAPVEGQNAHRHGNEEAPQNMPGMMGQDMGMMSMMSMMSRGPEALISAAEKLGLDERQVEALEEVKEQFMSGHSSHMEAARGSQSEATAALAAGPDWTEYEAALSEAAGHMAAAHVTMVRAGVQAKAVLTTEQLERLEGGMAMMSSMMPGMMQGMMQMERMEMMGQGGSMCMMQAMGTGGAGEPHQNRH